MTVIDLRLRRGLRRLIAAGMAAMLALLWIGTAQAAPFAAFVMDGRTGKEVWSQNADTPLHPASLTKMMTLYMAFTAIERGQVRLDSRFTVSQHAASMPPSRLGLRPGQQIELRYLIRAAAVKSANDAATAIGEGLAGSEPKFAAQMTAMARALGMRRTSFRNANGLTAEGHYSSARDMTLLGRRLFYDYPQYYAIFSRRSADAGVATVASTNARFLDSYEGADGIKTGYTRAAGFNLTASAQRGSKRIIATVMGGTSTAQRNTVMAELLDAGFGRAPVRVAEVRPEPVAPLPERVRRAEPAVIARSTARAAQPVVVAVAPAARPKLAPANNNRAPAGDNGALTEALALAMAAQPAARASTAGLAPRDEAAAARDEAVRLALTTSLRPTSRPEGSAPEPDAVTAALAAAVEAPAPRPEDAPDKTAEAAPDAAAGSRPAASAISVSARPPRAARGGAESREEAAAAVPPAAEKPARREVILASASGPDLRPVPRETVSRVAGSGKKGWAVNLGRFRSEQEAEQLLLKTALQEATTLDGALRKVAGTPRGFEAQFVGMTRAEASLACEKLSARAQTCTVVGP